MQPILNAFAMLSLLLLTVPSVLFMVDRMDLKTVKLLMLIATILWFVCTLPKMCRTEDHTS